MPQAEFPSPALDRAEMSGASEEATGRHQACLLPLSQGPSDTCSQDVM